MEENYQQSNSAKTRPRGKCYRKKKHKLGSLKYQITQRLRKFKAFGQSKHKDKRGNGGKSC